MYGDEHVVDRSVLGLVRYRHHGIELPDGTMCENSPPGIRIVAYADFARGRSTRVTNPGASAAEWGVTVQRALSRVGERRYSLSGNNCEHFASWCATGVAVSQQIIDWIRSFFQIAITAAAAVLSIALVQAAFAE
jgi:Lecithin retinol acyltransferase